jgi:hypothetical protein
VTNECTLTLEKRITSRDDETILDDFEGADDLEAPDEHSAHRRYGSLKYSKDKATLEARINSRQALSAVLVEDDSGAQHYLLPFHTGRSSDSYFEVVFDDAPDAGTLGRPGRWYAPIKSRESSINTKAGGRAG